MSSIAEPAPPEHYSFASPRKQLFAFPPDVISRMLENPSSHAGLMKLYQTCKYFYAKRPILIAEDVRIEIDDEIPFTHIMLPNGYEDISYLQVPLWLTNDLRIESWGGQRIPQLFRSSIKTLYVDYADIQYDDFVFLVAEKNVTLFCVYLDASLHHSDNSIVSIEEVLRHLPNFKIIRYFINEKCTLESLIKLNEMQFNNKFKFLDLFIIDVDSTFDFNLFCEFIKKNCDANTEFCWDLRQSQNLKHAFDKMNDKWKTEGHDGLKELFYKIETSEMEE